MDITKTQIAAIHILLNKTGLKDDKVKIMQEISKGRCSSTTQLTFDEAHGWIKAMNAGQRRQQLPDEQKQKRQRMINSIIAMAREMGVISREPVVGSSGAIEVKSNYAKFNEWLLTKSTCKKASLNDCTYEELPTLVTQYKAIYGDWLHKFH